MLFIAGLPIVFMELALGQFASIGCISVWKVVPLFKGIGVATLLISCIICIYMNMVAAWSIFYFTNSMKFALPWAACTNEWNTFNCSVWNRDSVSKCVAHNGTLLRNGSCVVNKADFFNDDNASLSVLTSFDISANVMPSAEYFHHEVLMMSDRLDNVGTINWQLAICLLIAWLLIFLFLFKGVKSAGKVVYVGVLAAYVILFVLFVRLLTLPGSLSGLIHFYTPRWNALYDLTVWGGAAVQVFYSLSSCTGGLITLASYSRFHNNMFKDIWLLSIADVLTSILAGALVYSAVGFMCYEMDVPIDQFQLKAGAHLVFIVLPEAIAKLPVAPIYALMYFVMIVFIILSTTMFVMETIVSSICDEFPERLRRNHRHVLAFTCLAFYSLGVPLCTAAGIYWLVLLDHFTPTWPLIILAFFECMAVSWVYAFTCLAFYSLGVPLCTAAGIYWLVLLDHFTPTWPLIILAFFECMAVSWVYGVDNFLDNIKWMIRFYPPPYIFWKIQWKFICPLVFLMILSFVWVGYSPFTYEDYEYPEWANSVGWGIALTPIAMIPLCALVKFCRARGPFPQRWRDLLCPEDDWGPALAIHRAEYYPLQIPEARRLILPPPPNSKGTNGVDVMAGGLEDYSLPSKATLSDGTTGSNRVLKASFLSPFDRETAI
uniref:Sodium-and chloride-dependent glycine transporter 2 n=1 Tax=Ascaris lumbricoides TaxID=6252 RepID=A0A0M3ILV8_ASCLU